MGLKKSFTILDKSTYTTLMQKKRMLIFEQGEAINYKTNSVSVILNAVIYIQLFSHKTCYLLPVSNTMHVIISYHDIFVAETKYIKIFQRTLGYIILINCIDDSLVNLCFLTWLIWQRGSSLDP